MTIPSVFFSIMAFIIVSTTSFIVLHNKSKVKHIDNKIIETNKHLISSNGKSNKRIRNLVQEIEISSQKQNNKYIKQKNEQNVINKKQEAKHVNLDKRFNSYKNITTANFMGMNNRLTNDNKRLQEDIDLVNKSLKKSNRESTIRDNELHTKINENDSRYIDFKQNEYTTDMSALDSRVRSLSKKNEDLLDMISSNTIDSGRIEVDVARLINTKISNTKGAIDNFFDTNEFVEIYGGMSREFFPNNFSSWYNNYYEFNSNVHFKSFEEMKQLVDENRGNIISNTENALSNEQQISAINNYLDSNLDKNNYQDYMLSSYNFDINKLNTISSNSDEITSLSSNIGDIQATLASIGLNDISVEGPVSLGELNTNISLNNTKIETLNTKTDTLFDTNFSTYFNSNQHKLENINYLSDNIDHTKLANKFIGNESLTLKDVNASNVYADDFILNGRYESVSDFINNNEPIIDSVKDTIQRHLPASETGTVGFLETRKLDSQNLNIQKLVNLKSLSGVDDDAKENLNDRSEFIKLKPGADLHLTRAEDRDRIAYGGNVYISSLDDIGEIGYKTINGEETSIVEYDERNRPMFSKFLNIDGEFEDNTVGKNLQDIRESVVRVNNRFDAKDNAGGITKTQIFNAIHSPSDNKGNYDEENWAKGDNGIRIENIYTGSYTNKNHCYNDDGFYDPNKFNKCKTVDARLENLELLNFDSREDTNMRQYMSTLDGTIGSVSTNIKLNNPQTEMNKVLATDVNAREIKASKITSQMISFSNIDNIKYYDESAGREKPFGDLFVKKTDSYVSDITQNADNNTVFTIKNKNEIGESVIAIANKLDSDVKNIDMINTYKPEYKKYRFNKVNSDSTEIKVPDKFTTNALYDDSSKTLSFTNVTLNNTLNNNAPSAYEDVVVDLAPDYENIKTNLGFDGNRLKIGRNCLKVDPSKKQLSICDEDCDNCVPLWDHNQAPPPIITSS